jgi:hypothetical protein
MNETNRSEVGDLFGSFLWNEGNVGGVQPMEIICLKVRELIYNRHNINLDGVPTLLKESSQKPLGPGALSLAVFPIAALTSSSVKGSLRVARSHIGVGIIAQLKLLVHARPLLIIFLKWE